MGDARENQVRNSSKTMCITSPQFGPQMSKSQCMTDLDSLRQVPVGPQSE